MSTGFFFFNNAATSEIYTLSQQAALPIKIRHVSFYAGHIPSNLLYRRSQLRFPASCDQHVRAFVDKLLRRREADAAVAASNECNLSFKLTHDITPYLS